MQTRTETTYTRRHHPAAGAVGGVVAAMVMAMIATMITAARGSDWATPARLVAATFVGEEAEPAAATFLGVGVHVVVGAVLGVVFGALTRRVDSNRLLVAYGLGYGLLVFAVTRYVVLPWANPLLLELIDAGWFLVYHLAFGLALGLTLVVWHRHPTQRWFGEGYDPRDSQSATSGGGSSAERGRTRSPAR